jgi:predicted ATPase
MKRIVITGGPGAGKTIITQRIAADHGDRYVAVPEAATLIYTALNTRWDKLDLAGKHDAQRRMYFLQLEQEQRLAAAHPNQILLLDRGTVDGAAYWPEGSDDFWRNVGSTHQQELARYDAVIMLETCAALGIYDHDASNPCRFEDPAAAIAAGEKLLALWSKHPHLHHVEACAQMEDKTRDVIRLLDQLAAL